jgi:hypothetical protein
MVFHAPEPIKLMPVGSHQKFWIHPIKAKHRARFQQFWSEEVARMNSSDPAILA